MKVVTYLRFISTDILELLLSAVHTKRQLDTCIL